MSNIRSLCVLSESAVVRPEVVLDRRERTHDAHDVVAKEAAIASHLHFCVCGSREPDMSIHRLCDAIRETRMRCRFGAAEKCRLFFLRYPLCSHIVISLRGSFWTRRLAIF